VGPRVSLSFESSGDTNFHKGLWRFDECAGLSEIREFSEVSRKAWGDIFWEER
jgi:hypothetical protein